MAWDESMNNVAPAPWQTPWKITIDNHVCVEEEWKGCEVPLISIQEIDNLSSYFDIIWLDVDAVVATYHVQTAEIV